MLSQRKIFTNSIYFSFEKLQRLSSMKAEFFLRKLAVRNTTQRRSLFSVGPVYKKVIILKNIDVFVKRSFVLHLIKSGSVLYEVKATIILVKR